MDRRAIRSYKNQPTNIADEVRSYGYFFEVRKIADEIRACGSFL